MRLTDLPFFAGQAVRAFINGLTTNLSSIVSIGLALVVVAAAATVWHNVELLVGAVRAESEIVAYFHPDATQPQIAASKQRLESSAGVRQVTLVDPGSARDRMRSLFGDVIALDAFGEFNPFSGYAEISVDPGSSRVIAAVARSLPGVEAVRDNEEIMARLEAVAAFARWAGALFTAAVLFMAAVVVSHIIRLGIQARSQDIATLRLLGASDMFVGCPFVLEGVMVGGGGGLAAIGVLWLLFPRGYDMVARALPFVPLAPWARLGPIMTAALAAIGILCGLAGSLLALRPGRAN